ncbi:hypothetical protein QBC40DRAFT_322431 [Triangularia verruculosa]|uniref:Uncharacterized protein n=1 Tax=Triangularia verruculosa TaxID=2587418 RepID=A0AAN7AX49_9PEZI|nr:hypothetical protein QBC40DRAFT_322431 [Triangularia verruculosa]
MTQFSDSIPVFCTARIPKVVLDEFFATACGAPDFVSEGIHGDVAVLINDIKTHSIAQPTNPPVTQPSSYPFEGQTPQEIWQYAQACLRYPVLNRAIAILDDQTLLDKETCLLVTRSEHEQEDGSRLLTVRSDFESALVILNVKNLGIGGDEHFTSGRGKDGVIRLYECEKKREG